MRFPRRHRGVALITAVLITALAGSVAAGLAWDSALDMRRTTVLLYRDQALQVALGAESWLQAILRQDLEDSQTDHLGEIWASELPGLPIDGGEVFGKVEDLRDLFTREVVDFQQVTDHGNTFPRSRPRSPRSSTSSG